MYVYIHVCMYVCMYVVCMYVRTYARTYVYKYFCMYVCMSFSFLIFLDEHKLVLLFFILIFIVYVLVSFH